VTVSFVISPLALQHDRSAFSCGIDALDRYLQTQAGQDIRRHVANCFVASPPGTSIIAGYYTFSATSIPIADLPKEQTRRLPRYPIVPAALIGRLAVDRKYAGRGLGSTLLFDAIKRALRADAAIFAIVVDAKDEGAVAFYQHHGFQRFSSRPRSLFIPVATAMKLLEN
jgi:ribosomal protein S18 acetylase RimI-like enzyme